MKTFSLFFIAYLSCSSFGWEATLFEEINHVGRILPIKGKSFDCVNLEDKNLCGYGFGSKRCVDAADQASSIQTKGTCVRVYRNYDCKEYIYEIKPGTACHYNWKICGFNNDIRSISGCSFSETQFCNSMNFGRKRRSIIYHNRTKRDAPEIFMGVNINSMFRLVFDDYERINEGGNPIYKIHYRNIDNYYGRWKLIQGVQAEIYKYHLSKGRSDFTQEWTNTQMTRMYARGYIDNSIPKDQKGHLVASQLSGPIKWYNLAPQTPALNANIGVSSNGWTWRNMENTARNWVKYNCGYVRWNVAINYDPHQLRPRGFRLFATFHEINSRIRGLVDNYYNNE